MTSGDFNQDSLDDLAVSNGEINYMTVNKNKDGETFQCQQMTVGNAPNAIATFATNPYYPAGAY